MLMNPDATDTLEHPIDKIPDEGKNNFDQVWEREWQNNLLQAALERVKAKVSPKQFQIFDYYVLREWTRPRSAGSSASRLPRSIWQSTA